MSLTGPGKKDVIVDDRQFEGSGLQQLLSDKQMVTPLVITVVGKSRVGCIDRDERQCKSAGYIHQVSVGSDGAKKSKVCSTNAPASPAS